jgi:ribosomal protein L40E
MKLQFEKIKNGIQKSMLAKVIVCLIVILLNVCAYVVAICLVPIAGVLFTFGIPVLLGWKNIKFLAGFGIPVIVGTAIIVAAYQTDYVQAGHDISLSDDNGIFANGTVTPYKGSANTSFNFTVEIKKENNSCDVVYLIRSKDLYILDDPLEPMNRGYENNTTAEYYLNRSVEKSMIWYYTFSINRTYNNGTSRWINITKNGQQMIRVGPVTMEYAEMLVSFIGLYLLNTLLMLGVGYYLLVSMYWWFGKAKERRASILKEMQEKEVQKPAPEKELEKKMKCSKCGAIVDADAEKCWKCGEKFENKELNTHEDYTQTVK